MTRRLRRATAASAVIVALSSMAAPATAQTPPPAAPTPPAPPSPEAPPSPAPAGVPDSPAPNVEAAATEGAASAPEAVSDAPAPAEGAAPVAAAEALPADAGAAAPSTADVDHFMSAAVNEEVKTDSPSLQLYGFADFTLQSFVKDDVGLAMLGQGSSTTMAIGNLNLYAAADLTRGWRSLAEIRFLYLPAGTPNTSTLERQSTAVSDYADAGRTIRWGGIMIERAYLEYEATSWLTIRGGQFLTPYGIWNVDHGSPTIIPVNRPHPIGEKMFPERQTGLELYGSVPVGESTIGYHATVSNGRSSGDSYQDFDDNKALGGRLFFRTTALGQLTLGVSGYAGKSTEADVRIVPSEIVRFENDIKSQFDELSYAADLLWKYEGLHVQGEAIANEMVYTEGNRPPPSRPTALPGLVPDRRRWGGYGLLGYRLPWLPLMPYGMVVYADAGSRVAQGDSHVVNSAWAFVGGINFRPVPSVALKLEWDHIVFSGTSFPPTELLSASAAWSF